MHNLCNGARCSVLEVIKTARRVTSYPFPAVVRPRRFGDLAILIAGSGKIQADLGWQPQHAVSASSNSKYATESRL